MDEECEELPDWEEDFLGIVQWYAVDDFLEMEE